MAYIVFIYRFLPVKRYIYLESIKLTFTIVYSQCTSVTIEN